MKESPDWLVGEIERFTEGPTLFAPARHPVLKLDVNLKRLKQIVVDAREQNPKDLRPSWELRASGRRRSAACRFLAEIIFQAPPSRRDPRPRGGAAPDATPAGEAADDRRWADYSYAHGGKDRTPFPVDRGTYDRNIVVLSDAVRRARLGQSEKLDALRRLSHFGRHRAT